PFTVGSMFNVPVLATNWISGHLLPFLPQDLILLKNFKYKNNGKPLAYKDLLNLDYGEFSYYNLQRKNIEVIDNTPAEILGATEEMSERLNAPSEQFNVAGKVWKFASRLLEPRNFMNSRFRGKAIVSEAKFARNSTGAD